MIRATPFVHLPNRRKFQRRPWPFDGATRRTTVDIGPHRIYSLERGTGSEAVVLLHGLSGSSRWWDRNLGALAEHYRVIVPDVIGFGRTRSPRPLPDLDTIAATLAHWMEAVDAPSVHLVGHSMGGQLAVRVAAHFPLRVRRLVLVDAAGIPRLARARELFRFATEVAAPARWGDPRFLPVIVGDAFSAGPRTIGRALGYVIRDDVRPLLPRVAAPTLVVWGQRDCILPPEHAEIFRAQLPDARLVILDGAAHNPMVDRPDDFNRVVIGFLQGESTGE